MTAPAPFTALVLAAGRGADDPLATARGLSHKCLVRVGGEPMLLRVLGALGASRRVGRIAISIEDAAALEVLRPLLPDRHVVGLGYRTLLAGLGGLHCLTQQQRAAA